MKKLVLAIFISGFLSLYAQQSDLGKRQLNWGTEIRKLTLSELNELTYLYFEGAYFENYKDMLPRYAEEVKIPSGYDFKIRIEDALYETLVNKYLFESVDLPSTPEISSSVCYIRKRPVGHFSFIPLRRNPMSGILEKMVSFSVVIELIPQKLSTSTSTTGNFVPNSVLSSGEWYKFSTASDGVFKIDYNFLKDSLGLDPASIDPRNLRIYGNGGGMLPEANSKFRYDDLVENAIFVSGESDGTFNPGDYILFYGQSPDKWFQSEEIINSVTYKSFTHQKNIYSTKTYYFLTASIGAGKRISPQNSVGTPTHTINTFYDRQFHEQEYTNVVQSGRKWYGDHFDWNVKSKNFYFSFPNLIGSTPVIVKTSLAGRSIVGNNGFAIKANGIVAGGYSFNTVGVNYWDVYAIAGTQAKAITGLTDNLVVNVNFLPSGADPESEGWLDYIDIIGQRQLIFAGNQMGFRDPISVGVGNTGLFEITSPAQYPVWEVTDPANVKSQNTTYSGGKISFTLGIDSLREFWIHTGAQYSSPLSEGKVDPQNIHGTIGQPDMVIVTHKDFISEANELADFHRDYDNFEVVVLETSKIYNEFSSGSQDISAIRDLMRMLYVRAGTDTSLMPQYLLLFGDASYDFKNIELSEGVNTNFVPSYQSVESLDQAITYNSDDFFGFLDENEGGNINDSSYKIDIGVGRIVAANKQEAVSAVKKIKEYKSENTFGSWRNVLTFVADDEDGNTHIRDANDVAKYIASNYPVYNIDKIYFDAYEQVSTAGGSRYPEVNTAINNRMFSGSLILNYVGHGGETGWAHERVLSVNDINSWTNFEKLPLFVTATCSFSRFDNPNRKSAGEILQLKEDGGTIGLITTVRLVYSNANKALNDALSMNIFKPINGEMPRLGQLLMNTKNYPGLGAVNNRKFTLLGDPALKLNYPVYGVVTTHVDTNAYVIDNDTIKALQKVKISGEVTDHIGQLMPGFNGVVYPTIFDKAKTVTTLKNDPESNYYNFKLQKNIIYRGKASVTDGKFSFEFIIPKDIAYNFGQGKISYYANNDLEDAHGFNSIVVGGTADSFEADNEGPKVDIFMNDESFVFGGITDENPIMLVKLSDENGINTAGSAIGHDISGILDDDSKNTIVLNEYYETALDDYQHGEVLYPLSNLKEGTHMISVKAWDVYNNPGEGYTEFVVASSAELALEHVLNYPNPFTTNTSFWFEHNLPGAVLDVQVQIFTVSGKLVKTIQETIVTEGFRVDNINWDGLDDYGDMIGKGVYVYRLHVRSDSGMQASKFEKLVILR